MNKSFNTKKAMRDAQEVSEALVNARLNGITRQAYDAEMQAQRRPTLWQWLRAAIASLRAANRRRRDYQRLLDMPAYLQEDVGLTPSLVRQEMRRPFFAVLATGMTYDTYGKSPFTARRG